MWTRLETVVTTTSITAVSASILSAQSTARSPDLIHSNTGTTVDGAVPAIYWKKIGQLSAAPISSEPVVSTLAAVLPIHGPPSPATIAASSGRKTMRTS